MTYSLAGLLVALLEIPYLCGPLLPSVLLQGYILGPPCNGLFREGPDVPRYFGTPGCGCGLAL